MNGNFEGASSGSLRGRLHWEYEQFPASNSTMIYYTIQASKTSNTTQASSGSKMPVKLSANNYEATVNIYPDEFVLDKNHWEDIYAVGIPYYHKSDGSLDPVTVSGYVKGPTVSSLANNRVDFSGTINIPTIPRYANVTITSHSEDETSSTISWQTDAVVTKIEYSINNGNWVTIYNNSTGANNGSFSITGLTQNNTYNIKFRATRKDSGLIGPETSTLQIKTYAFPTINNPPAVTIGNNPTVTINKPLSGTATITVKYGSTVIGSATTTGTGTVSVPITINSASSINTVYSSLGRNASGTLSYILNYKSADRDTKTGTINNIVLLLTQNNWKRTSATATTINKQSLVGNIFRANLNGTQNVLTVQYKYCIEGGSWTNYTNLVSNVSTASSTTDVTFGTNTFTINKAVTISGVAYTKSVQIKLKIIDSKTSYETDNITIPRGIPTWWWTADYLGVKDKIYINGVTIQVVDE